MNKELTGQPKMSLSNTIASIIHSQKFTIAWIDSKGQVNHISTQMGLGEQALITKVVEAAFFQQLNPQPMGT